MAVERGEEGLRCAYNIFILSNCAIASGLVASGSVYGPGLWRMCSRYFLARVQ